MILRFSTLHLCTQYVLDKHSTITFILSFLFYFLYFIIIIIMIIIIAINCGTVRTFSFSALILYVRCQHGK